MMSRAGLGTAGGTNGGSHDYTVRTTVVLPLALDRNLEIYCAQAGTGKSKLIERLLFDFLSAQGFHPDKNPKSVEMSVSY